MIRYSKVQTVFIMLTLFLVSPFTFAHSGNHYGEPAVWLIHLLWLAPVGLTAVYIAICVRRANRVKPSNELVIGVAKRHE